MFRACVDTGGTFTDCVVREPSGRLREFKSPSTPADFSIGVLNSLREAAKGLSLSFDEFIRSTELIVHGTTVATNALLTRNVAKAALVTTEGFRDVVEIRRSLKIETRSMYDAYIPPYEPLIPRRLRFGISERTRPSGEIVIPVDEEEVRALARRLRAEAVQAVSVCLINAYANVENERHTAELLQRLLGSEVFVTYSCELLAKLGEYERESTSIISACLGPIIRNYLENLEASLVSAGFGGQLLIMQANQFAQSVRAVTRKPAYVMGSGPAAAPAGAALLGRHIGEKNFITADMGGTTLDISLVTKGVANLSNGKWIGDDRLGLKVVDVLSVAAGGGSIGWIDSLGLLKVGPQSAGADPGPACFGKGGEAPTVTDAAVVLGYISPEYFWDGKLFLDPERARTAVERLAAPLRLSVENAAAAMLDVVSFNMGDRTAEVTTRQGCDVRDYALLAIGGAGPLCGALIAEKLNMNRVIVPSFAASFSAWSMFGLDIGRDYIRSYPAEFAEIDLEKTEHLFRQMQEEATAELAPLGVGPDRILFERSADIRYKGQYHELEVSVPGHLLAAEDVSALAATFAQQHKHIFSFDLPRVPLLLRSLRLIAKVPAPGVEISELVAGDQDASGALKGSRPAYFAGCWFSTPVYVYTSLKAGNRLVGPTLVEGATTTVVIPPGFSCSVDRWGNLVLAKQQ